MPNLDLVRKKDVSNFRKIAIGTWQNAYDPSVYGTLTLRMDKAMDYIDAYRAATGRRLTVSHLMAKAMAMALLEEPDANAVLRWNKVYLRQSVDVFFQVAMTDEGSGKVDLSGAKLDEVDQLDLMQIMDQFEAKVGAVRRREDPALEKTRSTFQAIPYMLLNTVLKCLSFLNVTLNLDLRWAGIPRDPFGSVMITNVGSLGLDVAFAPLVPYSRVPLLLALGAVKPEAVVEDGKVVVARTMNVNATFDHRFVDGFHVAGMSKVIRRWMEDPETHFGAIPEAAQSPSETASDEA